MNLFEMGEERPQTDGEAAPFDFERWARRARAFLRREGGLDDTRLSVPPTASHEIVIPADAAKYLS